MTRRLETLKVIEVTDLHADPPYRELGRHRWIFDDGTLPLGEDARIPLVFQTPEGKRVSIIVNPVGLEKLQVETRRLSAFAATGEWPEED